jgi:hypothetical protein
MPAGSFEGVKRRRQRAGRVGEMAVLSEGGSEEEVLLEGGVANEIVFAREVSVASTVEGGSFS